MPKPYFCAGDYCPGLSWPASNTPHPTSCAMEHLNSAEGLRDAAASRRAHGRSVKWEAGPEAPSPGQVAYEADVERKPKYHDGTPRRPWSELDPIAKHSWERPRKDPDHEQR